MTSIRLNDYVEQINKLIDDSRLVEAIEHCRHILNSYPRHIDTYRMMGKAFLEKQEYDAASDLFLRILSADPNDFISHVGLSIIYNEESQYDQALWHLERAFEIQPYNVAIQGELRQLYAVQTESRPGIIPLTRGALARLYMQGELYQQAIAELGRILAEEPERMDLRVLLAEALWRDDQRIDAEDACLKILDELPNCIVANAILAEIWLQTGRIPEAQKYLHRLHDLTWQTQKSLDRETIEGQAFTTDGAFPLPEEVTLPFLETGTVIPEQPPAPTDDWVSEVSFDGIEGEGAASDEVVLEPESGMHSYDWLADIDNGTGEEEAAVKETDWFSQDDPKESLNLSTGELNAEWLADLRGEDEETTFQPLDMEETPEGDGLDETDWFAAETAEELPQTAVSPEPPAPEPDEEPLPDWLDELEESKPGLQIDATNLIDDDFLDWNKPEESPQVVEEPKTPFWLSEMADEELDAVQLDPEEALDWASDFADAPDEEALAEEPPEDEVPQIGPTAVLDEADQAEDASIDQVPDTTQLDDADDWLSALTEGEIDEEIAWEADAEAQDGLPDPSQELPVDASTDELAALSDADDWLKSAADDLDAILDSHDDFEEEDEFPNLAIPELEGDDITRIPDWLDQENLDFSEEAEAAVSSDNDPQETPQPEEPKPDPSKTPKDEETTSESLDWLDELTPETAESNIPSQPPVETEGMPSWLDTADQDSEVELVDEWDSESAQIPDWLQDPVELADLDDDSLLQEDEPVEAAGLTGLLAEIESADDALGLDEMDSLLSDWADEEEAADFEFSDSILDQDGAEELDEETAVAASPDQTEEPAEEIGLTSLLSNLSLDDTEAQAAEEEAEDDFLAELWADAADDDLSQLLADDAPAPEEPVDLDNLDLDDVSLTELLSSPEGFDNLAELGPSGTDETEDDWFSDAAEPVSDSEIDEADLEPADETPGLTGLLANLQFDEGEDDLPETAVSAAEDLPPDLDDDSLDELGLTDLLAGIDYAEDAIDSEPDLAELDIKPVEPSLTEVLSGMEMEPEPEEEDEPISAEDTTWLDQLEADTGALQEAADEVDMAEETGLDWLTTPDEPEIEQDEMQEEPWPASSEDEPVTAESEADGTVEDWDDAMSWLEELAAQQDEPVAELPSVAETMLDEELDSADQLLADAAEESSVDWLDDLTSDQTEWEDVEGEAALDDLTGETPPPSAPEAEAELLDDAWDLQDEFADDGEISWLDELATDNLADRLEVEDEAAAEPAEAEPTLPDVEWLADVVTESEADELLDLDAFADDLDEPVDEEPETAESVEESPTLTGITDALEGESGIQAAEADLEEALAWLDELDDDSATFPEDDDDEAPPTRITPPQELEEIDVEEVPETVVVPPELDELALALDQLEQQVIDEGIAVPETAVFPLQLSPADLNAALDWIEQVAVEEPAWIDEASDPQTAVATETPAVDDLDDDPEAWLEQLLSDNLEMDVEMEPPPIKPSDDAVFATDDSPETEAAPEIELLDPEPAEQEAAEMDTLLDDVPLDGMPDDPDAAVAWLDQLATDEDELDSAPQADADTDYQPDELDAETAEKQAATGRSDEPEEFDLAAMEDDPEAWLEQFLSDDLEMDVEMEPPPIKPSEDAVFATGSEADQPEPEAEPEQPTAEPETIADETADFTGDIATPPEEDFAETGTDLAELSDEDPEAWLEQLLSDDLEMDVEMEPPPIKPSEDAVYATEDEAQPEEVTTDMAEPVEALPKAEAAESDIIADVPDDPDEAMAWLEQLAARQGAAIEELPSVTDVEGEPEMPDWMAEDLKELEEEADLPQEDIQAEDETAVAAEIVDEPASTPPADEDVVSELPDWLEEDDEQIIRETDWLQSLPEVDMDTWLTAEAEATASAPVEEIELPDTGPLRSRAKDATGELPDEELFEPIQEPSTGAYSVDEARLSQAQTALADGRLTEAVDQFKDLVAAGSGMMAIIAQLEQAADAHPQSPAITQLLGDAYMRNGQLQKALSSYRAALDQM